MKEGLSGLNLINSKMEGAYNRCKLPRITIVGSEEKKETVVEVKPTFEFENGKVDRGKAKLEPKRQKKAGSIDASRQVPSQSIIQKYFHSKPTKFRLKE